MLGHGRLPLRLVAVVGAIVVAHEQARVWRQRQDRLDRVLRLFGVAAGEVRARGADIGLHQRVMREGRVPAVIGDRAQRVAGREDHPCLQVANAEGLASREQVVEVARRIEGTGKVVEPGPKTGTLPIAEALVGNGVGLGTVLAFMMAVTALSLPSMIMLKRVVRMPLLLTFAGVVSAGILAIGFTFNEITHWFI